MLTWLPEALRGGEGVTEDALMPEAPEPVHHLPTLVQHLALHLILVGIRAPVARL